MLTMLTHTVPSKEEFGCETIACCCLFFESYEHMLLVVSNPNDYPKTSRFSGISEQITSFFFYLATMRPQTWFFTRPCYPGAFADHPARNAGSLAQEGADEQVFDSPVHWSHDDDVLGQQGDRCLRISPFNLSADFIS